MKTERIIYDIHTHIFPDKLALRASSNIGNYYGLTLECDGTKSELAENFESLPNLRAVISSASLKEETVRVGNDFLLDSAKENKQFIPFSSFYPFMSVSDAEKELVRVKELGSKGIKLHPDFQRFNADDSHVMEIYRVCAELGLPILFHVGDKNTDYSTPKRVYNVANALPELKIIAAHMCGYSVWDEAEEYLIGTNVYTEISDAVSFLPAERLVGMARRHGIEKVLFGSDYPLVSPAVCYEMTKKLGFTEEEKEKIYRLNAENLLYGGIENE